MLENLHCKCHICKVERHLFKSFTHPPGSVRFSAIALSSPALARFSNVSELLTDLHAGRNSDSGASLAGELVAFRKLTPLGPSNPEDTVHAEKGVLNTDARQEFEADAGGPANPEDRLRGDAG